MKNETMSPIIPMPLNAQYIPKYFSRKTLQRNQEN